MRFIQYLWVTWMCETPMNCKLNWLIKIGNTANLSDRKKIPRNYITEVFVKREYYNMKSECEQKKILKFRSKIKKKWTNNNHCTLLG